MTTLVIHDVDGSLLKAVVLVVGRVDCRSHSRKRRECCDDGQDSNVTARRCGPTVILDDFSSVHGHGRRADYTATQQLYYNEVCARYVFVPDGGRIDYEWGFR